MQSSRQISCSSGCVHSACVSKYGLVYTWGNNDCGQLGSGNNQNTNIPKQVPNLTNIQNLSCGNRFTICIDLEGNIWSFGQNNSGQLGIGNTTNQNSPQKIENIPPMSLISCGYSHTLCISQSQELWSFGSNSHSELCIKSKKIKEISPNQTKINEIISISCGYCYSMFQKKDGLIYTCGYNGWGQLGIGSTTDQKKPILLPNQINISKFQCGYGHSLFLDENGNVYGCGYSKALGSTSDQTSLLKLPNLPKIKSISTIRSSSIFIDENNNCWTVGNNGYGQLGKGNTSTSLKPKKIKNLENIVNISSSGVSSYHIFLSDKTGQIYSFGLNENGQLGLNDNINRNIPTKLDGKFSGIIKSDFECENIKECSFHCISKIMNWNLQQTNQMIKLNSKITKEKQKMELNQFQIQNQSKPNHSFSSWKEVNEKLSIYINDSTDKLNTYKKDENEIKNHLHDLENELNQLKQRINEIENLIPIEKGKLNDLNENFDGFSMDFDILVQMQENVCLFCENENKMEEKLEKLFSSKSIDQFDISESCLALWEMDLSNYQSIFENNQISFAWISKLNEGNLIPLLEKAGFSQKDICCLLFYQNYFRKIEKFINANDLKKLNVECAVCDHNTPELTILLLDEYNIPFGEKLKVEEWTSPLLLFASLSLFEVEPFSPEFRILSDELDKWKQIHKSHLNELRKQTLFKNISQK